MNKKLPYEEAFERRMKDLPPNGEEKDSWQKMNKLLDDNFRRTPFAFSKKYAIIGALILALFAGLWLTFHSQNSLKEKQAQVFKKEKITRTPKQRDASKKEHRNTIISKNDVLASNTLNDNKNKRSTLNRPSSAGSSLVQKGKAKTSALIANKPSFAVNKNALRKNKSSQFLFEKNPANAVTKADRKDTITGFAMQRNNFKELAETSLYSSKIKNADTSATIAKPQGKLTVQIKDSLFEKNEAINSNSEKDAETPANSNKKYSVNAGVAVQQQVPLGGQKDVLYGYNGKGVLSDYIPSVYFRFEKNLQWFIQAEYSYGAPQLVKEFSYSRQTQSNTIAASITTTTLLLKKTFYNRLPVSFNYYVRHNWSAGIGGMYSWFHGAIAEKEVSTKKVQTQEQLITKQIVPIEGYTDSFLYKSHTYLLLQTDYKLNRFSLGLRYTKDVQPYIKYTLPNGIITDQKNWSLEFILRFRLYNSTKFSLTE